MSFRRIAILGEIGSGNLGDDLGFILLRDALMDEFRRRDKMVHINFLTSGMVRVFDNFHYDAVLLGCGTLLDLRGRTYVSTLATLQARGVQTAIIGTGVSDPAHLPPTREGEQLFEDVVAACCYVALRGIQDNYTGVDSFWLLGWQNQTPQGDKNGTGWNMGYAVYTQPDIDLLVRHLRDARAQLMKQQGRMPLVSVWRNDEPWVRQIAEESAPLIYLDGSKPAYKELSKLTAAVAFRAHFGVAAACCGVYPIMLNCYEKSEAVFEGTEISPSFISNFADPGRIVKAVQDAWAKVPDLEAFERAVRRANEDAREQVNQCVAQLLSAWGE